MSDEEAAEYEETPFEKIPLSKLRELEKYWRERGRSFVADAACLFLATMSRSSSSNN
jgi:hypothetical protein